MGIQRADAPLPRGRELHDVPSLRRRPLKPAELRVIAAHAVALLASVLLIAASGEDGGLDDAALLGIGIFSGFSVLRITSVGRTLAISTIALDAVGTAVFLVGTDAPTSPHFFLALAGAWWAAHLPRRRTGLMWAVAFAVAYSVLVFPGAFRDRLLVHALEEVSAVVIVGLLSGWVVRVDSRAFELSKTLARAPVGAEKIAIRDGLSRALGPMEISIDVLLAAAHSGLTIIQAELLAYLTMGLTNQEIADATKVSVPTVRYRLTRLYKTLGVRGRKAAVAAAHELGLTALAGR
jgi:DNA-binding CsgD family transcriptional regulator